MCGRKHSVAVGWAIFHGNVAVHLPLGTKPTCITFFVYAFFDRFLWRSAIRAKTIWYFSPYFSPDLITCSHPLWNTVWVITVILSVITVSVYRTLSNAASRLLGKLEFPQVFRVVEVHDALLESRFHKFPTVYVKAQFVTLSCSEQSHKKICAPFLTARTRAQNPHERISLPEVWNEKQKAKHITTIIRHVIYSRLFTFSELFWMSSSHARIFRIFQASPE